MDIVAKHMEPDPGRGTDRRPDGTDLPAAAVGPLSYDGFLADRAGNHPEAPAVRHVHHGGVARMSLEDPDLLYHLFGVNAELLIDHAWGWEPCTLQDIRTYEPRSSSLGVRPGAPAALYGGKRPVSWVWEMADLLALDLTKKHRVTDQFGDDPGV